MICDGELFSMTLKASFTCASWIISVLVVIMRVIHERKVIDERIMLTLPISNGAEEDGFSTIVSRRSPTVSDDEVSSNTDA